MKKLMLLAAMLAMALMAASPAFAQIDQSEDNDAQYNLSGVNCTQILAQIGGGAGAGGGGGDDQYAGGAGGDDSDADEQQEQSNEQLAGEDAASVQESEFTAEQIQQCIAQAGEGNLAAQNVGDVNGDGVVDELDILWIVENGGGNGENGNGGETLPDTGGASLLTLGAGALLVAGGLIARRIVR